ncbi:MAG: arsenate reductase (glutaredoxin) [Alphaproteobacteria bacterium]
MSVKIYHNSRCSKSRQTLEIIRNKGIEPEVIEYLKDAPSPDDLRTLFQLLKLDSALPMVRIKEEAFTQAELNKDSSNDALLQGVANYPKLLERPIVVTDKGARICRPPELVEEIL